MSNTIEIITKLRDQLSGPLARQAGAVGSWQGKVVGASIAIAAAAAGAARALFSLADRTTQVYGQFYDLHRITNIAASQLHAMSIAAEEDGVSMGALLMAFRRMPSAIDELRNGGGAAVQTFQALGLAAADFEGLSSEDAFYKIAGALVQVSDENTRAALAQDLFGRSGMTLMPFLERGEAGMRQLADAARESGMVLGEDAYEAADAFQDKLIELKAQLQGATMEAIQPMLPQLEEMARQVMGIAVDAMPDLISIMAAGVPIVDAMAWALQRVVGGIEGIGWAWREAQGFADWVVRFAGENAFPGATVTPLGSTGTMPMAAGYTPDLAAELLPGGSTPPGGGAGVFEGVAHGLYPFREDVSGVQAELDAARLAVDDLALSVSSLNDATSTGLTDDIKSRKDAYIAYLTEIEDAQNASADRVAQHQAEATARAKQAAIESIEAQAAAEEGIARARDAAINRGIDQTAAFGLGMIHAGLQGQEAWDQFWDNFAMRMFDMVMSAAFGMLLQIITGGGSGFMGSLFGALFQHGGTVQRAASGMTVPGIHRGDRVPALLEPGERVLTREEARGYAGGGGSRGSTVVNLTLGSMFSGASRADLIRAGRTLREVMKAEGLA